MRKLFLLGVSLLLLVSGLILFGQRVSAQGPTATPAPKIETRGDAKRLVNGAAPDAITSLPMSNPFCSQPDPSVNQCSIVTTQP